MNKDKLHNILLFAILLTVSVLLAVWDFFTGSVHLSFSLVQDWFSGNLDINNPTLILIREFRITRVVSAILAGAALSLSGLLMQTIFRNPLAGPYVLGISSGAGLGVAVLVLGAGALIPSMPSAPPAWLSVMAAAAGAALVMFIILVASFRVKDIFYVLILGILIGAVVAAMINLLQFFASDVNVKSFVVWGMGSLYAVSFSDLKIMLILLFLSSLAIYTIAKPLNLIMLGEDYAKTSGVNVKMLRIIVFVATSILAGTVTAFCGPLGFIGVAAPHITRWIFRTSNHFILIPGSLLTGAIIMLSSDLLSHAWMSKGILPINAVTAIIGIPFIIYIVLHTRNYSN